MLGLVVVVIRCLVALELVVLLPLGVARAPRVVVAIERVLLLVDIDDRLLHSLALDAWLLRRDLLARGESFGGTFLVGLGTPLLLIQLLLLLLLDQLDLLL
jgi:hypothetical protein